ncbi:hypothetical protein DL98DRAFT_52747 [Cadophora sp. DSE1049]|nr:hypothetical protein DL98DRAFT_52747 [Cadophora sp. DSE1049]
MRTSSCLDEESSCLASEDVDSQLLTALHNFEAMDLSVTSVSHSEAPHASFAQFTEFPSEIRQLIWEAALPGPRIIKFEMKIPHDGRRFRVWSDLDINGSLNDEFFNFDSSVLYCQICPAGLRFERAKMTGPIRSHVPRFFAEIPIITAVCRESRAVAEMFYTLAFGSPISPPRVWFSFERDTLHMSERVITGFEKDRYPVTDLGPDFAMVKHISLAESYLDNVNLGEGGPMRHQVPHSWCSKTISWFGSLQSITYTINPDYQSFKGALIFVEVRNIATAFDRMEELEDDMWPWPFPRSSRKVKATDPLPDEWERGVMEAISSEVEIRARLDDFKGAILPKVDGLKIYRMALSTAQDPDMSLKLEAIMKELDEWDLGY